jgi:preprotein translocase subunit SecA
VSSSKSALDDLEKNVIQFGLDCYEKREEELTPEMMRDVERYIVLRVVDQEWKDHLYDMDQLKSGIGLRAYGQKDPLIEYKTEGYKMFIDLLDRIDDQIVTYLFRVRVALSPGPQSSMAGTKEVHEAGVTFGGQSAIAREAQKNRNKWSTSSPEGKKPKQQPVTVEKTPGRNDPCPCGSGKKYKKCCGIGKV